MKLIGQGNTAEIYEFDNNKIVKLFRPGVPETIIHNELERTDFIESIIPNVPKNFGLIEIDNRIGIIYSKVEGTDMIQLMLKSLNKTKRYSKEFAQFHFDLHKNHVYQNKFSLKDKLFTDIDNVSVIDAYTKKQIKDYVKSLPAGNSLCHFDFHPGNIMIEQNSPVILDWMTSCVGNKFVDVARTYIVLRYGEFPHGNILVKTIIRLFQKYIAKIYLSEYLNLSNSNKELLETWFLPIATARLSEWISPKEQKQLLQLINNELKKI
ncbi:aminoglycoside phosphotransferase family protein [Enterococcus gilvus]|uniref:Aminoglycoside phosphotransferase domain-containing protein n=1 Tax=Enterococcus gilvus ATCC BAA-350 TaxID=1158614 RepID=R2XTE0_9ENTE|nr:aminoglycoside phosphotransferase family protein [Enterococcus gilvus]EOI58209.1 hypothetical protein UKC_00281 [Enterococcus gilvus ATCC BAA-350]EOW79029.1 hypothetical protein I592_03167 [Enterococcus gilvus ATCC BAA-350]OJG43910.1 hypothetical protein RV02_GL002294 [Enterococcus gilvus]